MGPLPLSLVCVILSPILCFVYIEDKYILLMATPIFTCIDITNAQKRNLVESFKESLRA